MAGYNATLMHQARTVCPYNVFCTRSNVAHHLIMPHLHGYRILFYGKHTAKAATLVFAFMIHDFHPFYL